MTIDDLARMTQKGFEGVGVEIKELLVEMNNRFKVVDERFKVVDEKFKAIDERFDRMENRFIGNHENRIERLGDNMRIVKTTLKIGK